MTIEGRIQLTGGGDAAYWRHGWALVNAEASPSPSSLQLEHAQDSTDGTDGTYRAPLLGSGTQISLIADETEEYMVLLTPGDWIRATGTGTINVIPQHAPVSPAANRS